MGESSSSKLIFSSRKNVDAFSSHFGILSIKVFGTVIFCALNLPWDCVRPAVCRRLPMLLLVLSGTCAQTSRRDFINCYNLACPGNQYEKRTFLSERRLATLILPELPALRQALEKVSATTLLSDRPMLNKIQVKGGAFHVMEEPQNRGEGEAVTGLIICKGLFWITKEIWGNDTRRLLVHYDWCCSAQAPAPLRARRVAGHIARTTFDFSVMPVVGLSKTERILSPYHSSFSTLGSFHTRYNGR